MPDESFFGALRLVMLKVKKSLSDGRPNCGAVRRSEPWMKLKVSHIWINCGYVE
jgi:hypothetical protein